jgi:hypothetical protein
MSAPENGILLAQRFAPRFEGNTLILKKVPAKPVRGKLQVGKSFRNIF